MTLIFEPLFELWTSVVLLGAADRPRDLDARAHVPQGRGAHRLEGALVPDPPPRHPGPAGPRRLRAGRAGRADEGRRVRRRRVPGDRHHHVDERRRRRTRRRNATGCREGRRLPGRRRIRRRPLLGDHLRQRIPRAHAPRRRPDRAALRPRRPRGGTRRLCRRLLASASRSRPCSSASRARRASIPSACGSCSTSATASRPATTRPSRWPRWRSTSPTARCSATAPRRERPMRPNLDFGPGEPDAPYLLDTTQPGSPTAISRIDEDALKKIAGEWGVGYQHRIPGTEPRTPTSRTGWAKRSRCPRSRSPSGCTGCRSSRRSCCCSGIWCSPPATSATCGRAAAAAEGECLMGWFGDRFEREEKPAAAMMPARRRRMLLLSMILVIPLGCSRSAPA